MASSTPVMASIPTLLEILEMKTHDLQSLRGECQSLAANDELTSKYKKKKHKLYEMKKKIEAQDRTNKMLAEIAIPTQPEVKQRRSSF